MPVHAYLQTVDRLVRVEAVALAASKDAVLVEWVAVRRVRRRDMAQGSAAPRDLTKTLAGVHTRTYDVCMTKIAVGTEVTWNRFSSLDKPMQGKVVAVDSLLRLAKVEDPWMGPPQRHQAGNA